MYERRNLDGLGGGQLAGYYETLGDILTSLGDPAGSVGNVCRR